MLNLFGFIVGVLVCAGIGCLVIWFAMGAFHQHLKNRGEGLGDAATKTDLAKLEEKLRATFATKH